MTHKLLLLTLCAIPLIGTSSTTAFAGSKSWDSNADHWSHYKRIPAQRPPPLRNSTQTSAQANDFQDFIHAVSQTEPESGDDYVKKYYGKHENNARYNN